MNPTIPAKTTVRELAAYVSQAVLPSAFIPTTVTNPTISIL